jgi:hypothetical protein
MREVAMTSGTAGTLSQSHRSDPVEYLQKVLGSEFEATQLRAKELAREGRRRRFVAYGLKAIAIFCSLALTVGLPTLASQVIGVAIAAAVASDFLFSNHMRLITVVKATQAYRALERAVMSTHQGSLAPILDLKETSPEEAKKQLQVLNNSIVKLIHEETGKIEQALDESDIKALSALSLEGERRSGGGQAASAKG